MKQYAFRLEFFDRIELRTLGAHALDQLNALGAEGWHIVHVRDDPQHARDLAVFLERETVTPSLAGASPLGPPVGQLAGKLVE